MKIKKRLYTIISFLLLISCSKSSVTLAEFKGGTVTDKELSVYYDMNYLRDNPNAMTTQVQSQILDEISIGKIIDMENQKDNIVPNNKIDGVLDILSWQVLFNQYREKFQDKIEEDINLATSVYILYLSNGENRDSLADSYLAELNKENFDFKKFIQKNTEEVERKSVSGRIEPVCLNCGTDPFMDMIKTAHLQKGKFVKIKKNHGIYLINVLETKLVEKDDLASIYNEVLSEMKQTAVEYLNNQKNNKDSFHKNDNNQEDYYANMDLDSLVEQISNHFLRMFQRDKWDKNLKTIVEKNDIVFTDLESLKLEDINENTILIQKKGESISFKDLENNYDKLRSLVESEQSFTGDMKKEMILRYAKNSYFPNYIIRGLEEVTKLKETQDYKNRREMLKYNIITPIFISHKFKDMDTVSEQELLDTYEAGKNFTYSKPDPTDPSKKIPKKFEEVKEEIRSGIVRNRSKAKMESYMNGLKESYDLKMYLEKLQEGQV